MLTKILLNIALAFLSIRGLTQSLTVSFDETIKNEYSVWEPIEFPILIKNNTSIDISIIGRGLIHLPDGTDAMRLDPSGDIPFSDGRSTFDSYKPWNPNDYPAQKWTNLSGHCIKANRKYYFSYGYYQYNIFPSFDYKWRFSSPIAFPLPTGKYIYDAVVLTNTGERYIVQHKFSIIESSQKLVYAYQNLEKERNEFIHRQTNSDEILKCSPVSDTILFAYFDTCKTSELIVKAVSEFGSLSCDYKKDLHALLLGINKIEDKTATLVFLKKLSKEISPHSAAFYEYYNLNKYEYIKKVIKKLQKRKDPSIAESFFGYVYEEEAYDHLSYPPKEYPEQQKYKLTRSQLDNLETLVKTK